MSHYRNSDSEAEPPQAVDAEAHARAVAEYLGDMIGQLESMARHQGMDLLVYLLSMARVEAETTARDKGSRRRTSA
jgi:NTP pyrophosphatase (non-canonical NTP hydrolase)